MRYTLGSDERRAAVRACKLGNCCANTALPPASIVRRTPNEVFMSPLSPSRPRRFWIMGALMLALLTLAACNLPGRGNTDSAPNADAQADAGAATDAAQPAEEAAAPIEIVATDESFNGLPVGFTDEGWPFRGNPAAPLTMYEFSDFQCPFCARYFVQTEPAINESWVQDGRLRVVFRDLPLEGLHPNAPAAHEAALCVAEQGAALYWSMHAKLFESQAEWSNLADPQPIFARLAEESGADAAALQECIASDRTLPALQESLNAAAALGFDGTPSFHFVGADGLEYSLIGAQPFARFADAIDSLLAGTLPVDAESAGPPPPAPGIPFWASIEGVAVDPEREGYTVAGDLTRGNPDASVVVIEFSDLQCPYCKRHHEQTQPALDAQFVDTGQVRWVFKHFPLAGHAQAVAAGAAAECAADQDAFWEMYTLLFGSVSQWSNNNPDPTFIELADQLALDVNAFTACLQDPDKVALVLADQAEGTQYVQGTPTFIILNGASGRIIPGALPLASFVSEIEAALAEASGS
jgi:protein-disulfide isomerase